MKTILLSLCLMAVAVTCFPRPGRGHHGPKLFKESFDKCLADNDIPKEELKNLYRAKDPKVNCLMSCTLTAESIMDEEGNIDEEKMIEKVVSAATSKSPQTNADELTANLRSCAAKAKDVEDKCTRANSLLHCMKAQMKGKKGRGQAPPSDEGEK